MLLMAVNQCAVCAVCSMGVVGCDLLVFKGALERGF